ncbi:hypothetical protein Taro_004678, partial [Colocasia esculenta]|nr:hypothetical protein [Colocasia esculenta]
RRQHRLPLTRSQRQGIWPSTSWLRSLATNDVDAKFFGLKPYKNPNPNLWNLPQSPGSRRTLRELPRELHHATTIPRAIQQRHAFYNRPTTLRYLLEALGILGQQAGARAIENRVGNLPSGEPITCIILRLASTPLPPMATAIINVHILSGQDHAVNDHIPGHQQLNGHTWPPTPTELQQVGVNPSAANGNRHHQRPHLEPPRSCSKRPHTWTPTGQRPYLAANSN